MHLANLIFRNIGLLWCIDIALQVVIFFVLFLLIYSDKSELDDDVVKSFGCLRCILLLVAVVLISIFAPPLQ